MRRQEVKELIESLSERYPDLKQKLFGAMQRCPLYGWAINSGKRRRHFPENIPLRGVLCTLDKNEPQQDQKR